MKDEKIKVGIGFATGRKRFHRVLRSYVYSWKESSLVDNENIGLNLFVAYDVSYHNTEMADYTSMAPDISAMLEGRHYFGGNEVEETKQALIQSGVVTPQEAAMVFGKGYASQRNILLYQAIKSGMDCLLFLDDDEYPLAVTKTGDTAIWGGQHVLKTHLENIKDADITYGYHCGYISPIPHPVFSDNLVEDDFRVFIQAISNDIVTWENLKRVMDAGDVTYADTAVLLSREVLEVPENHHAKFISGSNLCINLRDKSRVFPFYNPPGARGEDTFLSTCLSERKVLRVPCYAFHDGFSTYQHLLSGVLPTKLSPIPSDSEVVLRRFYHACIGWIRYKPLLLNLTDPESYRTNIEEMQDKLRRTLPQICDYYHMQEFRNLTWELERYDRDVEKHRSEFQQTKQIWARIMDSIEV